MSERFQMGDETFHDHATSHEWTVAVSAPLTWAAAHAYARDCRTGGHADWRVPEVGELWALVDHSAHSPATWPALRAITPPEWFWSATPYALLPSTDAWGVGFYGGHAYYSGVTYARRVRCVRGGRVDGSTP